SYMDYAMSVIIGRALPDVRDGLKPANRRVLFGMQQMGLQPGRPYRKCANIDKDTVDFQPTSDSSGTEPMVLPTVLPNLLVNGAGGIAVGMATNIPPHNLGEVIDAVVHFIEHPESKSKDLMKFVKGPDFPTGAIVMGRDGIKEAYETGRGSIKVRAVTTIEEAANGRQRIVVTELPYQVNKARLAEKIADLVRTGR